MKSIIDWTATPLGTVVLGYVLLGLCNFFFKPKSPEEYAAMAARGEGKLARLFWPRFAAFLQFLGGLLLDPAKVAEALGKMISGRVRPVTSGSVPAPALKGNDESGPYRDGFLPIVVCLIGALSLLGVAPVLAACSSPGPATPEQTTSQKEHAADASYTADMGRCTVKKLYPTFEESKACTASTRARWGRLPDGGADRGAP